MKKIIAVLLTLAMLLSFSACGRKNTDVTPNDETSADETVLDEISSTADEFSAPKEYYAIIQFEFNPTVKLYITNACAMTIDCTDDMIKEDFGDLVKAGAFSGKSYREAAKMITERAVEKKYPLANGIAVDYIGEGDRSWKLDVLRNVTEEIKGVLDKNKIKLKATFKIESKGLTGQELTDMTDKFTEQVQPEAPKPPAPTDSDHTNWDAFLDYVSIWFAAYKIENGGENLIERKVYFTPTENLYVWRYTYYKRSENPDPVLSIEYDGKKWEYVNSSIGEKGYLSGSQLVLTEGNGFVVFDCVNNTLRVAQSYIMFSDFSGEIGTVYENTGEIDIIL